MEKARWQSLQQTIFPPSPAWRTMRGSSYYAPRLRAAIVGTGGISRIHGWRLQDLGSTVVGVCGRDVGKARSVADDFRPIGQSDAQGSSPVGCLR